MLFNYCIDMHVRYFSLPTVDVRRLAYQLAIMNRLPYSFLNDKAANENKWLNKRFRRYPRLSIRLPQGISAARVK
jgi:hypothetical protein